MMSSLYTGVTGLKANSDIMDILSNNISNTNTTAYKRSSGAFFDFLSTSLVSGGSDLQIGRGVYMGSVLSDFTQGTFQKTESATDLGVEGDGFFVLRDASGNSTQPLYTRNGQFILDKDGYLVSTDYMRVQGYQLDPATNSIDYTKEADIQISNALAASSTTKNVTLGVNLNADTAVGTEGEWSTTLNVYDSQGRQIPLTFNFIRTATNSWTVEPSIPPEYGDAGVGVPTHVDPTDLGQGTTVVGPPDYQEFVVPNNNINTDTLKFWEDDGAGNRTLKTFQIVTTFPPLAGQVCVENDTGAGGIAAPGNSRLTFNTGDIPNIVPPGTSTLVTEYTSYSGGQSIPITFNASGELATINGNAVPPYDFGISMNLTTGAQTPQGMVVDIQNFTQFATAFDPKTLSQDGFGAGALVTLDVSQDGYITGHYSNGLTQEIARLMIGQFRNEQGLLKIGNTRYVETRESGQAIHTVPSSGQTTINSYSLEASNVDIAAEFVNLITAQRAYTANTKVISTVDTMLSDLMNIKR